MSYLAQVSTGIKPQGQKIVISAAPGMGKTTLACQSPGSLLIPLEDGYKTITSPKLPMIMTWAQVEGLCQELVAEAQRGKIAPGSSIVWDSATALERLIHIETLNRDTQANKQKLGKTHSMETAHDGYGKAYPIANDLFAQWLSYQDQLAIYGGINIVVTCHVFVVRVIDPAYGEYDTSELLLHSPKNNKNYGKREHLTQWADLIGYLHEPMIVTKNKDEKISRGIDANQGRVLEVEFAPAWTAKNRYKLTQSIPISLDFGWNNLAEAIHKASTIDIFNRALVPTK